jgi:hypothetical protein
MKDKPGRSQIEKHLFTTLLLLPPSSIPASLCFQSTFTFKPVITQISKFSRVAGFLTGAATLSDGKNPKTL